jgi:hypothetical protein
MKSYTIIFVLLTILIFRSVSGGDEIPHKENPTWLSHLPQDVQKAVLWYADHEEGSLHDWKYDDLENSGGGIFNTGSPNEAIARTISDVSFSGEYSVQATIRNAYRCKYGSKAVHLMRWTDRPWDKNGNYFPKKAYYSTWMVIPKNYNPNKEPPWDPGDGGWWNIFQFKSDDKEGESRPIWVLNIGHDAQTESMIFYLYTKYNQPHSHKAQSQIPIPVGKWFYVSMVLLVVIIGMS